MGVTMNRELRHICILRTDRIGDVVLTLPMASVIKHYFPSVKVTFAVREYTADIIKNAASVDGCLVLKNEDSVTATAGKLKAAGIDAIFIVSPNFKTALAATRAGIPVRVGTANRWYSCLFTSRIADHRSEVKFHEAEYNIRMLSAIGIQHNLTRENVEYGLHVPDEAANSALHQLDNFTSDTRYLIIHPGSGGSAVDWPEERFTELIDQLSTQIDCGIILTGSQQEFALCERISRGKAVNLAGKLSLVELMGIIQKSFIFVANSTGPLHIASALQKSVIGFYPRVRVCSARRWGPYTMHATVFEPGIPCQNCTTAQCAQIQCMRSIGVNQVVAAIKTKFEKVKSE
jgi:ADP-heptose:LPS heptosyltransferase